MPSRPPDRHAPVSRRALDELAIFGGPPAFAEPLHVGRPNVGDRERLLERVGGALDRRWLTNDGPLVDEFEARMAARAGAEHCIAVCNGTSGLQLARARARAHGRGGHAVLHVRRDGARDELGRPRARVRRDRPDHAHARPRGRRSRDHAANERAPRRPPLGAAVRRGRARGDRRAPRPRVDLRRRPRARLHPRGPRRSAAWAGPRSSASTRRRSPARPRAARSPRTTPTSPSGCAGCATSGSATTTR